MNSIILSNHKIRIGVFFSRKNIQKMKKKTDKQLNKFIKKQEEEI